MTPANGQNGELSFDVCAGINVSRPSRAVLRHPLLTAEYDARSNSLRDVGEQVLLAGLVRLRKLGKSERAALGQVQNPLREHDFCTYAEGVLSLVLVWQSFTSKRTSPRLLSLLDEH